MRALYPWILGAALAASGCSLSLQFDCQEDGDCANLEGTFVCSAGACVEIEADMAPDMMPEPEGFSCADDQPLLSSNCSGLLGPLAGSPAASNEQRQAEFLRAFEEYELIAVAVPAGGLQAAGKDIITAAVHFAINHINESGGLTFGDGQQKLLAALVCNDANADGSPEAGIQAAQHAVACGAKAIVGTYSSTLTVELFREVAQDADIPVIAPGAISPQIPDARQTLGDDELLWRIKVPGEALIRSVVGLIEHLGYQNVHVFYRPDTPYDEAMRDELRLVLAGNAPVVHALTGTAGASADQVTAVLAMEAAQGNAPDLVVSVVEDLADLLDIAVGMIDASTNEGLVYDLISVEGGRSDQAAGIIANQRPGTPNPALPVICRAMGISSGSKNGNSYTQWLNKFRAIAVSYGIDDLDTRLVAPVPAYVDAVFVTAYAMASALRAGDGEITTVGLVDGLKLLSDPAIDGDARVQPHQWTKGLDGLGPNGSNQINYDGASGSIDLDPATQDVRGRKTELWQYLIGDSTGLNELGDLVPDAADDFDPDTDVVDDLLSTAQRPACQAYPFVGTPPMP